jgi:IPTL-CTERM motif
MGRERIMSRIFTASLVVFSWVATVAADELLFEYTGDVLPYAGGGGFPDVNFCENPEFCSETFVDGHLVVQWFGQHSDFITYVHRIPDSPESLWVEWRFRSNTVVSPFGGGCNGQAKVQFREIIDRVSLEGDLVEGGGGGQVISGLPLDEFYTVRFESRNGLDYEWTVDGRVLRTATGNGGLADLIGFGGFGCVTRDPAIPLRDEWDFVRYGTISDGEVIMSSNPPAGDVDVNTYPNLDRFTVTFNTPGFVQIDDIIVTVADASDPPIVLWTKRMDNDTADRVQIVLDRPLTIGTTTTFTLDTGGDPQVVTFTYLSLGACCFSDGSCNDSEESQCNTNGGSFSSGESCESTRGCCYDDGSCLDLAPACCQIDGGIPAPAGIFCDNDPDGDSLDAACGDNCPSDPFKTEPNLCGCGVPDTDSDGDTVPDCLDQCPGRDDTRDFDNNNIPDCIEFFPIPTVSTWGLVVLTLLLGIASKLAFGWRRSGTGGHPL